MKLEILFRHIKLIVNIVFRVAWLPSQTRVHAMEMPGKRFDIGNLESYRNVCGNYRGIIE